MPVMSDRRPIIGGNWKMYKTPSEAAETAKALRAQLAGVSGPDVVICPPATSLLAMRDILSGTRIKLGGQNFYWEEEGAFTGEISARMLIDAGCEFIVIGHSERRHVFGESDQDVNKKIKKALASGLKPIFCVGETLAEREAGKTEIVVGDQLHTGLAGITIAQPGNFVIAYEPVWAIGTGVNASPAQAEEVHKFIRELLSEIYGDANAGQVRLQYGGSVKPGNAAELLSQKNIDGALVGGASLDAESFSAIVAAA